MIKIYTLLLRRNKSWLLLLVPVAVMGIAGSVRVADVVAVVPKTSVTVTVYVPAATEDKSSEVALLLHAYVYGALPPVTA